MRELTRNNNPFVFEKTTAMISNLEVLGGASYSETLMSSKEFSVFEYEPDERIFSRKHYRKALALLIEGKAVAKKTVGFGGVSIRFFLEGELFGIAALFGNEAEYVSDIYAQTKTVVAFISQEAVTHVLRNCPDAALAYISFLSQKIRFLNKKIDGFSAPNAQTKLCLYFLEHDSVEIPMQTLANTLGMSRMTLYRSIDQLVKNGCIQKEGKRLTVINRAALDTFASDEIF